MTTSTRVGRFAVRFVHLDAGWRWWVFESRTGFDTEHGLRADGYDSQHAARRAAAKADKAVQL
ncbi:MAG: hypothetical protein WKG00_14980 [Polyangiaceae bacterium]